MLDFTHSVEHKNFEVLIVVDDHTYSTGCAETGPSYSSGGEPAELADVEVVGGHVELDFNKGSFKRLFDTHVNATDLVFDALVEKHTDCLHEELLEHAENLQDEC